MNPFLYAIVRGKLTRNVLGEVPWCKLFADAIVLIDEIREGVNDKLKFFGMPLSLKDSN